MSLIKIHIMKQPIKFFYLLIGILFFTFTACQDEVIEETAPNEQEIIQSESNLANLMRNASANDGSVDNLLDNSDCFTVNLPVTIEANGITLTIETLEDLSLLEAIFDASNTDEDDLGFLFPITIILNDYTEVNIDSVDALEAFIGSCMADEDLIECADFVYPISFSIYNTSFQIIDTVVIDNDYELYIFLEGLEDGNSGAVLTSLNFPVSIQYTNGTTVEVTNNQALEEVINAAGDNCEDDCELEDVSENLQECNWVIAAYNANNDYLGYHLYFNENNLLQIIFGTGSVTVGGEWFTSVVNGSVVVTISALTDFTELEGDWIVEDCDEDRYVLIQETGNQTVEMVLEQDCSVNPNPFACFEEVQEINANIILTVCDSTDNTPNNGVGLFDLTTVYNNCESPNQFNVSYHISETNAQANVNGIANPEAYLNTSVPAEMIYVRVELISNPSNFDVFTIDLFVENCNPSGCSETDVDMYLQGCNWKVVSFNGDDHLITYNIDFSSNTEAIITGNGVTAVMYWSSQQSADGVVVEFNNVSAPDIQAITGSWLVVACEEGRLQFEALNSSDTMVMECYYYTVDEMLSVLSECQWEVYSFQVNNVDQTSDYDDVLFTFFENDFALAEVGTSIINYGNLERETGNSDNDLFVLLAMTGETFSLGGYYTVISMTEDEITFYDSQQPRRLILRKTCVSDNQDADTTQIKDWLNDGNWEVTYSTMENVENSEDYDGITFGFQSDATLLGDNGSWMAELGYEVLRDQEGNLRFVINYLGQFPYWQMDDDWYITEVNSTRVEVHSVNDDNNMEFVLVFEKQ